MSELGRKRRAKLLLEAGTTLSSRSLWILIAYFKITISGNVRNCTASETSLRYVSYAIRRYAWKKDYIQCVFVYIMNANASIIFHAYRRNSLRERKKIQASPVKMFLMSCLKRENAWGVIRSTSGT